MVVSTGPPHVVTRLHHLGPGTRGHSRAVLTSPRPRTQTLQPRGQTAGSSRYSLTSHLSRGLAASLAGEKFLKTFYSLVLSINGLLQLGDSLFVKLGFSVSILLTGLKYRRAGEGRNRWDISKATSEVVVTLSGPDGEIVLTDKNTTNHILHFYIALWSHSLPVPESSSVGAELS